MQIMLNIITKIIAAKSTREYSELNHGNAERNTVLREFGQLDFSS